MWEFEVFIILSATFRDACVFEDRVRFFFKVFCILSVSKMPIRYILKLCHVHAFVQTNIGKYK